MLYLKKLNSKIYLILLCGLITLNVAFVSSKNFTANIDGYRIDNATEMQYQICLSSLPFSSQMEFINNTEIKYFLNLPEKSFFFIYLGYFLVATGFILTAKIALNNSSNENR